MLVVVDFLVKVVALGLVSLTGILRFDAGAAEQIRVLYGGSCKPSNAPELLALPDVDGALVGGASLDPADFAAIVEAATA